ncbi:MULTISPECIES: AvrD family protein [unclassified Crossiella]|uniref:AvrD family protein n=1 Tax=unclassified Crossiella TaxID=2620835 RepID=UPI001FFE6EA5|nr:MULTISPECIES: AvrD family protein [unclassified Crossiella]MCK2240022.1 AvrD family protein [Crossiella sp. S99.2]MCK2252730.1 AvrD family protein [Crossiella sp. S99.1]
MSRASTDSLHLPTIEDYLGPATTRYFGDGHKRTRHHLHTITLSPAMPCTITATAAVDYPSDWSRKDQIDQPPHLSTIDVIILAVRLAEIHLTQHDGLSPHQLASAWLCDARIKAGNTPVQQELAAFDVLAHLSEREHADEPGRELSTWHCRIGSLTATIMINHPRPDHLHTGTPEPHPIWNPHHGPFGTGVADRGQHLADIHLRPDHQQAHAHQITFNATGMAAEPGEGLEGLYQPAISVIDLFVAVLQLGQVMLYQLDGIDRDTSHTLWMRRTHIIAGPPRAHTAQPFTLLASLFNTQLLQTRTGETWRRADITSYTDDGMVRCSVAHQLP